MNPRSTSVPEKLACQGFVLVAVLLIWAPPTRAEALVADLTSHLIAITTGFTGASVVLFGATDGGADVVAMVRGPEHDVTIWRKSKIAGIWANTESVTFANIPSFYAVAASKPLAELLSPSAAALYKIGTGNLKFEPRSEVAPDRAQLFANALVAVQKDARVFSPSLSKIVFLGDKLF